MNFPPVNWLDPWWSTEGQDAAFHEAFRRQLALEVGPGHPLFGLPARLLARGEGDDALFEITDGTGRVAVVHLTWAKQREQPPWPCTLVFPSLAAFVEQFMVPEAHARQRRDATARRLGRLFMVGQILLLGGLALTMLYLEVFPRVPAWVIVGITLLPWLTIFVLTLCNAPPPIAPRSFRRSLLAVVVAYALLLIGVEVGYPFVPQPREHLAMVTIHRFIACAACLSFIPILRMGRRIHE